MTATATLNRTFTETESSAVNTLNLSNLPMVQISFRSNPEKVYTFESTADFSDLLVDLISTEDLEGQSVGRMISGARAAGDLKLVQI
jgi:hypothetical protein